MLPKTCCSKYLTTVEDTKYIMDRIPTLSMTSIGHGSGIHAPMCAIMAHTGACMPKMATNHIYITPPSLSQTYMHKWNPPVLPDGFLGGSGSRLQEITLNDVPFPVLPTLSSDFVVFRLENISQFGYISPE